MEWSIYCGLQWLCSDVVLAQMSRRCRALICSRIVLGEAFAADFMLGSVLQTHKVFGNVLCIISPPVFPYCLVWV